MKISLVIERYVHTIKYFMYGIILGFIFPVTATLLDIHLQDLPHSFSSVIHVQAHSRLHWLIDTAPIIVAILAAFVGYGKDEVVALNKSLEALVARRTHRLESKNNLLKSEIESRKNTELELMKAKESAESAATAKSQFLSTMSHEMRTPLNAIIGLSGLLVDTKLNNEQTEFINTINKSGENLLSIINNVLDYAKIESGKLELEEVEFSVADLIEDVLDLTSATNIGQNVELLYSITDSVPSYVFSDLNRIQQVLVNLVMNATKFTEEGEILVSVDSTPISNESLELTFSVKDTGIGIPKDKINNLFEKFNQVDASTTRKYGGTGLGLAISKILVELMNGTISVKSEEGVGSEFTFNVEVERSDKKQNALKPHTLKGKSIFILDDNDTNLYILRAQCEKAGMEVTTFSNPLDVIASINELKNFDIGILDMQMPKKDGIQVAHTIRKKYSKTELPLVLLSSMMEITNAEHREHFNLYLTKPIKRTRLLKNIERVFANVAGVHRTIEKEISATAQPIRKLKVLIAEDNIINQKVAGKMIERLGHNFDVVANGKEALDMVSMINYDLILMDMEMPIMDGLVATREIIKIKDELPSLPIIIAMTANAMEDDRKRCLDAGMHDFLPKPVTLQKMDEMLKIWFSEKVVSTV